MPAITVNKAIESDAESLANVLCRSWRDSYASWIEEAELARRTNVESRKKTFDMMLKEGKATLLLAKWDGIPCGLCCYGPSRDPDLSDRTEIISLYTLKEYWGKKVGLALMDHALANIESPGVFLWVIQENQRARKFYEKSGFVQDGSQKSIFGNVAEVRYQKNLFQ
jgi:ribosomal protein S18 acetylase RimI-like enzyme